MVPGGWQVRLRDWLLKFKLEFSSPVLVLVESRGDVGRGALEKVWLHLETEVALSLGRATVSVCIIGTGVSVGSIEVYGDLPRPVLVEPDLSVVPSVDWIEDVIIRVIKNGFMIAPVVNVPLNEVGDEILLTGRALHPLEVLDDAQEVRLVLVGLGILLDALAVDLREEVVDA